MHILTSLCRMVLILHNAYNYENKYVLTFLFLLFLGWLTITYNLEETTPLYWAVVTGICFQYTQLPDYDDQEDIHTRQELMLIRQFYFWPSRSTFK